MSSDQSRFVKNLNRPNEAFTVVWNELLRAPNISGNALKMYLSLLSNSESFEMSTSEFRRRTGLGRFAFERARDELVQLGMLTWEAIKHAPGTTSPSGRAMGGQYARTDYQILEPRFTDKGLIAVAENEASTEDVNPLLFSNNGLSGNIQEEIVSVDNSEGESTVVEQNPRKQAEKSIAGFPATDNQQT